MLTKIRHFTGLIFMILGMCSANDECLIYPFIFMGLGILLIEDLLDKDIEDTPYGSKK